MTDLTMVTDKKRVTGCIGIENTISKPLPCSMSQIEHIKNGFIQLTDRIRLRWDKKQWIVQVLSGKRYRNNAFCSTKYGLLNVLPFEKLSSEKQELILSFPASIHDWHSSLTSSPPLKGGAGDK